jgi:hypothetical protein
VPTDKQVAANRRNSRRSTGPRSSAGTRRVSHNAYQHGLSISVSANPAFDHQIEELARAIVGTTDDEKKFKHACMVAAAELDLARVRRAKVALIEQVMAFGTLDQPPPLTWEKLDRAKLAMIARRLPRLPLKLLPPVPTMPSQEPDRSAEAIKRALPELVKFDRYEQRARVRRDRAILQLQIV